MKTAKHVIRDRSEEFDCEHCGCPLYVGETAYIFEPDDGRGWCSPTCRQYHASDAEHRAGGAPRLPEYPD